MAASKFIFGIHHWNQQVENEQKAMRAFETLSVCACSADEIYLSATPSCSHVFPHCCSTTNCVWWGSREIETPQACYPLHADLKAARNFFHLSYQAYRCNIMLIPQKYCLADTLFQVAELWNINSKWAKV